MKCSHCGNHDTRVVDTRESANGIRRRRECNVCGRRFTTQEQVVYHALTVVKRDGHKEPWRRDKLTHSVQMACAKRPVRMDDIARLVEQIETIVLQMGRREVRSEDIGRLVSEGLKSLDPVAYIRYGIVFLSLPSIATVQAEMDRLLADERL